MGKTREIIYIPSLKTTMGKTAMSVDQARNSLGQYSAPFLFVQKIKLNKIQVEIK